MTFADEIRNLTNIIYDILIENTETAELAEQVAKLLDEAAKIFEKQGL